MTVGSPGSGERSLTFPCRQAGKSCAPEVGQRNCVVTPEQIRAAQDRGDVDFLGTVALCQLEQSRSKDKDPKTGLYILEPMLAIASKRFSPPRRKTDQITAERTGESVSTALVAFVDINHFGDFNVSHGHRIGDIGLAASAALLRENTRETDLLARWGEKRSDEFVAIMTGMSEEHADRKATLLQEAFAQGVKVPTQRGESLWLTAAVGSAFVYGVDSVVDIQRGIDAADASVMAWKGTEERQGRPERQYLIGSQELQWLPTGYQLPSTS